jgi:hypothetical protein
MADFARFHDCPDYEDNLILDLACEVGALIIEPTAFAAQGRRNAPTRKAPSLSVLSDPSA